MTDSLKSLSEIFISPAKATPPVAQSTPASDDVPGHTDPINSPLSIFSASDDVVQPHPSPSNKILINIDSYDEASDRSSAIISDSSNMVHVHTRCQQTQH